MGLFRLTQPSYFAHIGDAMRGGATGRLRTKSANSFTCHTRSSNNWAAFSGPLSNRCWAEKRDYSMVKISSPTAVCEVTLLPHFASPVVLSPSFLALTKLGGTQQVQEGGRVANLHFGGSWSLNCWGGHFATSSKVWVSTYTKKLINLNHGLLHSLINIISFLFLKKPSHTVEIWTKVVSGALQGLGVLKLKLH